jgi:hypothetical protein
MVLALMAGMNASAAPAADDALLRRFEQALASTDSATAALAHWCAARGIAGDAEAGPVIRAVQVADTPPALDAEARTLLAVGPNEPLGYRHVRLMCGGQVLSDARNWYVPARLTPAMNHELTSGERPFGAVIAPLHFTRERLDSRHGAGTDCPADTILTNRALIRARGGEALALVVECYQRAVLK